MPKAKSKAQQRLLHHLADQGIITQKEASARSKRGKAYKALPKKKKAK